MKRINLTWFAIVLNVITTILATAILILILTGDTEPVKSEETVIEVICECACDEEEPTEPIEVPPVTEPTIEETISEEVQSTEVTEVTEVTDVTEPEHEYIGEFKLTAYCPCSSCCGQWADGITSTGVTAQADRTIAVDPKVIPYGTEVVINGNTYVAEDCGGSIKGNRIDIYFNTHSEALAFGIQYANVYIIGS